MRTRWHRTTLSGLAISLLAGCSPGPVGGMEGGVDASTQMVADAISERTSTIDVPDAPVAERAVASWELPQTGPNRFLLPWPSDLTLTADGFADLRYLVSPAVSPVAGVYVEAADRRLRGFSPNGSVYFRFGAPISEASVSDGTGAGGLVLMDIDPASPERGMRRPMQFSIHNTAVPMLPEQTLVMGPAFGNPLRPRTRYAAVVLKGVRSMSGAMMERDRDLETVMASSGGTAAHATARMLHEPAFAELERAGIMRDRVLSIAVFTTNDPTLEMRRVAQAFRTNVIPAPSVADLVRSTPVMGYEVYTGHIGNNPVFQTGEAPYIAPPTGDIEFNAEGVPRVQSMIRVRFVLAVPQGTPPATGWPLVVYGQGTGGEAPDFIRTSERPTFALLRRGIAVLSYDQVFVGERSTPPTGNPLIDGSGPGSQFFNYANPIAGRLNNVQSAADLLNIARLAKNLTIPATVAAGGQEIKFNPRQLHFYGHSQGSVTGPLALAVDDSFGSVMLSGAGGTLSITIMQRRDPVDIRATIARVVGIRDASQMFDRHPVVVLAQTVGDTADAINYARYIIREPMMGVRPHHLYMTEGIVDAQSPPDSCLSLARALGLDLVGPVVREEPMWNWGMNSARNPPVRGNARMGSITAVLRQYRGPGNGHFVVFDLQDAADSVGEFFATAVSDPEGVPTLR